MSDAGATMGEATILIETEGGVCVIRLNRPRALNALSAAMLGEITTALAAGEADDGVRCFVITGSERAFAAGADIAEMASQGYAEMFRSDFFAAASEAIARCRKPIIAAVCGYALGGGCELAMLCDIIIAADTAKFGQPEINLGVAPGIGGTQRLPRAVGKALAMDMILTARIIDAAEAERAGLVSRVVPAAGLMEAAMTAARKIASLSPIAVMMNKEMVMAAYETPLSQGVRLERRLFHSLFAFEDQAEGMAAFTEKRAALFRGK